MPATASEPSMPARCASRTMRAAAVHRADHGTAASFSLVSEFASIRLSLDTAANGPRVLLEDLETGAQIHLDPLELASLCRADEEDRVRWLRVGVYRDDAG